MLQLSKRMIMRQCQSANAYLMIFLDVLVGVSTSRMPFAGDCHVGEGEPGSAPAPVVNPRKAGFACAPLAASAACLRDSTSASRADSRSCSNLHSPILHQH